MVISMVFLTTKYFQFINDFYLIRLFNVRSVFILILIFFTSLCYSSELKLKLDLIDESKLISITLLNNSPHDLLISTGLGLNLTNRAGLLELNLVFSDENGIEYHSNHELRAAPSGETFTLEKGHFYGRTISLTSLVPIFKLKPQKYFLQAVYCYQKKCHRIGKGVYSNETWSNKLVIEVPVGFGDKKVIGVRANDEINSKDAN